MRSTNVSTSVTIVARSPSLKFIITAACGPLSEPASSLNAASPSTESVAFAIARSTAEEARADVLATITTFWKATTKTARPPRRIFEIFWPSCSSTVTSSG